MTSSLLQDALTPPDCDLRDFPFMPLEVQRLRRSKAWLLAKRKPELGFYMVNLWTAAWHERPAASLEDDDDVLADLAMCEPRRWEKVRDDVMRGWTKCPDGRLYHPTVAEKANAAWAQKQAQRQRTEAARLARAQKRNNSSDMTATEDAVTTHHPLSSRPTVSVTENVDHDQQSLSSRPTSSKREGEGEGESKEHSSLRAEPGASLDGGGEASGPDPADAALAAWDEICVPTLARLRKVTLPRRRAILARLREDFGGDLGQWRAYLRRIVASPLLTGGGERGWKADLDWVLVPQNLNRILEGRYDPPGRTRPTATQHPARPLDPRYWDRPPAEVVKLPKPDPGTPERDAWDEATYGRAAPRPAALRATEAA